VVGKPYLFEHLPIWSQIVCQYLFVYFAHTFRQLLTPWPLDNHKVVTCISSLRHMVSLPHGYAVNTTCMSQIY
jgi:hypothetical protein